MKISVYGDSFLIYVGKKFEKDGHTVLINQFSHDIDLLITNGISKMYIVYRYLKTIKKNGIKFINFILDVPPWRLDKNYPYNSILNNFRQNLYHFTHKNQLLYDWVNYYTPNPKKNKILNLFPIFFQKFFNTYATNQTTYLKNYRKLLTYSDLNLSISKFTQKLAKTYLKIDSNVCYPCVNSDLLLKIPKYKKKYDVINISRIVPQKHQDLIVKAAKKLGLKVVIIGPYHDRSIKLDCPHYFLFNQLEVFKKLSESSFYVDASEFEGFGRTPIEAAYLDKITIASDIYTHKEILGDYPIYFKKNDFEDLIEKMKDVIINGNFFLNNVEIKKKYSIQAFKKRILKYIESIFN